jgi:hypothetical protein
MMFWKFLLSFFLFTHYIVDNDGAGGDDDGADDDIGDIDIDQEEEKKEDKKEPPNELETIKKELADLRAKEEARDNDQATQNAISEIKGKYADFDANKVKEFLVNLNKTDPKKANALNNPIGWENIYLTQFAPKNVENDDVSFGRNVDPVERGEEVMERVKNGEIISVDDELSIYGKLL